MCGAVEFCGEVGCCVCLEIGHGVEIQEVGESGGGEEGVVELDERSGVIWRLDSPVREKRCVVFLPAGHIWNLWKLTISYEFTG